MSASSWTHCPRCTAAEVAQLALQAARVQEMYGTVPIAEFDKARSELALERGNLVRREKTFREDYEITGAQDGVVRVDYAGTCTECGLQLLFNDVHPLPGFAPASP